MCCDGRWTESPTACRRPLKSAIPPAVEYRLTEPGSRIATKLQDLTDVIYDELPAILAHRAAGSSLEQRGTT